MALWDLYGQLYKIPVYKLMGGAKKSIVTDITISVNDPEEMAVSYTHLDVYKRQVPEAGQRKGRHQRQAAGDHRHG